MMKKKKTLYIMLPLVALVWGVVFYQLYTYFFSEPTYATQEVQQTVNIDEIKKDTFSIVANYRDPFLGKKIKSNKGNVKNNKANSSRIKMSKSIEKPWPVVTYKGMIKNNNSNRRVGIVIVGGKERLVKEGDIIDEVKIVKIEKEIIKVRFQKESKTITK